MIPDHKKPTSFIIHLLSSLAFLSLGIYVSIIGFDIVSEGRASMEWPQTKGIIESSKIVRMDDKHIKYQIEMNYRYEVKGESYKNGRISLNSYPTRSARTNADIVNPYPVGKEVTVYYNPENPVISVLRPGISSITFIPVVIGFGLIVISIASLLARYRETRKRR